MCVSFAFALHNQHSKRSAIVPYTFIKDSNGLYELWVLLGKHSSGEITDLGGGVKIEESDIDAAFREFHEETRDIFTNILKDVDELNNCISIYRPRESKTIGPLKTKVFVEGLSTIFLPVSIADVQHALFKFKESSNSNEEITELMCIKGRDILQPTSSTYKMWSFIRKFYYESLTSELSEMLFVSWLQKTNLEND